MSARGETQALRKRMLIARAALERLEIADTVAHLRQATRAPRLFGASLGSLLSVRKLPLLVGLLRRYPFTSTGASLVLNQVRKRLGDRPGHPLRTALKWGALAGLGYQAWRVWQRHRPPRDEDGR